jgi:putative lipoic acid-binding regulatory protein
MNNEQAFPLAFPCRFPIKAMGLAETDFDALVTSIIRRYVPHLPEGAVASRASRGGKYLAVTVTIEATSREQLDAIYRDLAGHARVLMAL